MLEFRQQVYCAVIGSLASARIQEVGMTDLGYEGMVELGKGSCIAGRGTDVL